MKRTVVSLLAGLVFAFPLAFAFPTTALATLEQGLDAYRKGDYVFALKAWQPLATKGNPDAQNNLGVLYEKGQGVERNFVESVNWYRRAAEQGHAQAQNNVGVMYERGLGVKPDAKEAASWYLKAAQRG
ncbi:MAG: tetratricopeptide repeat protein, partial [Burkholderiales bacterium]|nr:tetratricopeptide repeat protein [Burkholderiales bacterium]